MMSSSADTQGQQLDFHSISPVLGKNVIVVRDADGHILPDAFSIILYNSDQTTKSSDNGA